MRELPDGLTAAPLGSPIAPGFACPVVAPGGLFAGGVAVVVPPAVPPAAAGPAACASPIEPESASALTKAIVASFMGYSLVQLNRDNPKGARDVPSPPDEDNVRSSHRIVTRKSRRSRAPIAPETIWRASAEPSSATGSRCDPSPRNWFGRLLHPHPASGNSVHHRARGLAPEAWR
jgi:hypothetical protein